MSALLTTALMRRQGLAMSPYLLRTNRKYAVTFLNRHEIIRARNIQMKNNMAKLYVTSILAAAARNAKLDKNMCMTEAKIEESIMNKTALARTWDALTRMTSLAVLFAPSAILFPVGYLSENVNEMGWAYTVYALEKAGPTFIKLAQWASTRSDIFGEKAVSKLSKLRDQTSPHKWKQTELLLRSQFGEDWEKVFEFGTEPIGSGCIAQVYCAKLKQAIGILPAGTKLAVKVQHPGLWKKVSVDFYIMEKIGHILEGIPALGLNYLSISSSIQTFKGSMIPQLNFKAELDNLTTFRTNFGGDAHIRFPMGIEALSTETILTESYCVGTNILEFQATMAEKRLLAKLGLEMVMKMIFLHDFVHGDLHPGNILVDRIEAGSDNSHDSWWSVITGEKGGLVLNVIDCGLVVKMGLKEHENLVKILGSFIKREGYAAGKLMIDYNNQQEKGIRNPARSDLDEELFCRGIERICIDDHDNNFLEKVGDYLADICYLACKHRVKLEAKFINAALACEIMEGIACSLYPDMEVQSIALPMVFKAEVMHGLRSSMS
mmetsp:Transcript_8273/g.12238  ORF Transcript_8273/g.12238 Transcript_8273/m.12238 type:complete len:548 (-) Transcript_8273:289-1932(-)